MCYQAAEIFQEANSPIRWNNLVDVIHRWTCLSANSVQTFLDAEASLVDIVLVTH